MKRDPTLPLMYSVAEVATILRCSRVAIQFRIDRGTLACAKVGKTYVFSADYIHQVAKAEGKELPDGWTPGDELPPAQNDGRDMRSTRRVKIRNAASKLAAAKVRELLTTTDGRPDYGTRAEADYFDSQLDAIAARLEGEGEGERP